MIVKSKAILFQLCLLISVMIISSCNRNKVEQIKHIPKDATLVLAINPMSFYDKMKNNKGEIDSLINSFVDKMANSDSVKQQGELAKEAFDFKKSVYFFIKASNSIAEGKSISGATIIPLKNKDKFVAFLKSTNPLLNISEETGFSFTQSNKFAAGWNKDIAIILSSGNYAEETANKASLESLFNLKESESIASDDKFLKSFDAKSDISFYTNSSQSVSAFSMLALTKASDLVKDVYSAGTLNFNNGSIDINLTTYPNSTLLDLVKKNPAAKLNGESLQNYPGQPEGIIDFSINIKQLISILNYMGVDQMINPFLQKQNLSLDDIAAAFKGEIAFAASSFRIEQKQSPYYNATVSSPQFNYLLCIPVADKKAYDKIISAIYGADNALFVNKNGQYVPATIAQSGQGFLVNDKYLLLASSQSLIDSFDNAKGKIIWPEGAEKNIKGKTSYFYGDLQNILSAIPATGGSDSSVIALSKNTFKEFDAWGNDLKGNKFTGEAHLYLQNTKENSLITLGKYFQQLKSYEDKYKNAALAADSLNTPSADDNMNTNIPVPPSIDTSK